MPRVRSSDKKRCSRFLLPGEQVPPRMHEGGTDDQKQRELMHRTLMPRTGEVRLRKGKNNRRDAKHAEKNTSVRGDPGWHTLSLAQGVREASEARRPSHGLILTPTSLPSSYHRALLRSHSQDALAGYDRATPLEFRVSPWLGLFSGYDW